MPRFNFYLIFGAFLAYVLTSGVTLRDRLLISTLNRIERNAYVCPTAKDLFEGAMSGLVDVLEEYGDEYSSYIPSGWQAHYLDKVNNRYEGFGISIRLYEDGEKKAVYISYPLFDSHAYRQGLRSGDQILQIDGVPVANFTDIEDVKKSKGEGKREFCLSVLPFGQTEPKEFSLHLEKLHFDSVEGDYRDTDGQQVFCLETHPRVGYIRITSFTETTAEEFGIALDRMMHSGAESFILDLRDNGGGDVWNCVQIARMLLSPDSERNVIVSVQSRNGSKRSWTLNQGTQRCSLPMAVLIDGETASSSEILAAALQDYRRATIVGTRSFGKGVIQGVITLPFQSGILQLTDSEYRRPGGGAIHRKQNAEDSDEWGIIPDVTIEFSESERAAVLQYRSLYSNVISSERLAVLGQFRKEIIAEQEGEFEYTGMAPYYDAQLDQAIDIVSSREQAQKNGRTNSQHMSDAALASR